MNNYYIYIHYKKDTNIPFYVGKGKGYRISATARRSDYWKNIVSKYGYYYEVLEDNLTENEAFELEKFYITYLNFLGFKLCNLTEGGEGSSGHIFKPTQEWIDKKSKAQIGENNSFYGKTHSEESKLKIAQSKIGKIPHNKKYFTKEEKRIAYNKLATKYREQRKIKQLVKDAEGYPII